MFAQLKSNVFGLQRVIGSSFSQPQSTRQLSLLANLKPSYKSTHKIKRLGRGPSSGHGKTSGRGQKGQKARGSVKSWFEGGQTPIFKLFPKVGFTPVTSLDLTELNLKKIQRFYNEKKIILKPNEVLTMKKMKEVGLITGNIGDGVKILGDGKDFYNIPIKIEATKATNEAVDAIKAAGGDFTATYFNKLGLRAHLAPNWFLKKYGRIPLPARPTRRKDIEYYSRENGYLTKTNHPLLQLKQNGLSYTNSSKAKSSVLEDQLALANDKVTNSSALNDSGVISIKDL